VEAATGEEAIGGMGTVLITGERSRRRSIVFCLTNTTRFPLPAEAAGPAAAIEAAAKEKGGAAVAIRGVVKAKGAAKEKGIRKNVSRA